MSFRSLAVLALAAAAACAPAAPNPAAMQAHSDSVKAGIDAMNARFSAAMVANQVDTIMQFYAADAVVMPPNMPVMRGADAIKAGFTGMMSQGAPTMATLTAEKVTVSGDMAVEQGRYVMTMPGPNNTTMADSGKYIAHWHKMGDKWVMVEDMWNSNLPVMPMPAPARRRS